MEVFVRGIPPYLKDHRIESFIYAVVQKEKHFILPLPPLDETAPVHSPFSASPSSLPNDAGMRQAVPNTIAPVSIDKGFFFQRGKGRDHQGIGFITFSRPKVGQWFLEYAQRQNFVKEHHLSLKPGKNVPTQGFVRAITANATDQKPSTSVQRLARTFAFDLALMGYWSAPNQFNHTRSASGRDLRLTINEKLVIVIKLPDLSISFLPREVKRWGFAYYKDKTKVKKRKESVVLLFELRQNPQQLSNSGISTRAWHNFQLPSRVIRISFAPDKRAADTGQALQEALQSVLGGVRVLKMSDIEMTQDDHAKFIEDFFVRSQALSVELAFQREALLRNELLNISALDKINNRLDDWIFHGKSDRALLVLKNFVPKLELRQVSGKSQEQRMDHTERLWKEACKEADEDSKNLLTFLDPVSSRDDDHLSQFLHIDITPTRVLLSGPQWHVSNRVMRAYRKHWACFARVTFTNEDRESITTPKPDFGFKESEGYIKGRVVSILKHGLHLAGRQWELLAWSSSSMSTHTVWFVTPFVDDEGRRINADVIRRSLGDFSDVIRSPARYGARLSQAFSATARTIKVPRENLLRRPDIVMQNGGASYTDGLGQISSELMAEVWDRYVSIHGEHRKRKLLRASAPSAIQIRLGGNKGVLLVNPRLEGKKLIVRPSMTKFGSPHHDLEVASSSSRSLPARLNRPLINALGDRGVPAAAFLNIQQEAITLIGRARSNFQETANLCSAFSFGTGCNLRVLFEKLHGLGLSAATLDDDNFFLDLAKAVTAAALGDIKRKARIPVEGVTLIGVADEHGFLKEGEVFVQVETVSAGEVRKKVLTGRKLIGRSPTVDPGDVAMVNCVQPPKGHPLLQLRNVIVFDTCSRSQPLPSRLGGGDLDGDLYTIYDDARLYPTIPQPDVIIHTKTDPRCVAHECGPHDLAFFFADFMLNDIIGLVSYLHLRISDDSDLGSNDEDCKTLAKLHSVAVDFKKSGVPVPRDDLPVVHGHCVPDFLAQGEKREGQLVYPSSKALGYLFRAVSWNETDTPSLDSNTDPETGLIDVDAAALDDMQCDASDSFSDSMTENGRFSQSEGSNSHHASLFSIVTNGPTEANGTSSVPHSTDADPPDSSASPWPFKDVTFPPLLQSIGWNYRNLLPSRSSAENAEMTEQGHQYVMTFQWFTREFRGVSLYIAGYHPQVGRPSDGPSDGEQVESVARLVSEVYMLTGRLPWSTVTRKARNDRDSSTLESMRSLCTQLRKRLCHISESAAFGTRRGDRSRTIGTSSTASVSSAVATHSSAEDSSEVHAEVQPRANNSPVSHSVQGPRTPRAGASREGSARLLGQGTADAPFQLDSSDDEDIISIKSDDTVQLTRVVTPRAFRRPLDQTQVPLRSITNTVTSTSIDIASVAHKPTVGGLKRKASQELEAVSHQRPPAPAPLQISATGQSMSGPSTSTTMNSQDNIEYCAGESGQSGEDGPEEEEEEGAELTVVTAQKIVDSLWKACHFFCSPRRPRYSNVYGYNTFMITLTLHLLSMLETLKHLHRDQGSHRRYFQQQRSAAQSVASENGSEVGFQAGGEEKGEEEMMDVDYEEEEDLIGEIDEIYSLTEDAMAALDLGNLLLDLGPNEVGYD